MNLKKALLIGSIGLASVGPIFGQNKKICDTTNKAISETVLQDPETRYKLLVEKPIRELSCQEVREIMTIAINKERQAENERRAKEKLPPLKMLTLKTDISKVATKFCKYGNENGNFVVDSNGNYGPKVHLTKEGKHIFDRLEEEHIAFDPCRKEGPDGWKVLTGAKENIVGAGGSIKDAMETIKKSKGHYIAVIGDFDCLGIGTEKGTLAIVQVFIKKK